MGSIHFAEIVDWLLRRWLIKAVTSVENPTKRGSCCDLMALKLALLLASLSHPANMLLRFEIGLEKTMANRRVT